MANSSPERDHIEALKVRAAEILVKRHPVGGSVQMPAKELIQLLCARPAIDRGAAELAINELINEGKLSLHWKSGVIDGEAQYSWARTASALGGVAKPDPFDFQFVRVEDSDWLDAATVDCLAKGDSTATINVGGRTLDRSVLPIVSIEPGQASIEWDGVQHPCRHNVAEAFQKMIEAKGRTVGLGTILGGKPGRIIQTLPASLRMIVERDDNKGYRLTIFD